MPPCLKNHVVTKRLDRCSIVHLLLLHVARLPVPPPTPPHVHVAPGHPSPEEHVENFFRRHITLKKNWLQCWLWPWLRIRRAPGTHGLDLHTHRILRDGGDGQMTSPPGLRHFHRDHIVFSFLRLRELHRRCRWLWKPPKLPAPCSCLGERLGQVSWGEMPLYFPNLILHMFSRSLPVSLLEISITGLFGEAEDFVIILTSSHTFHRLHLKIARFARPNFENDNLIPPAPV